MKKKDLIPNIPHHHHYVPQRYLSKWLNDDNQFYVLDLDTNKVKTKGTKRVCFETDLYNLGSLTFDERKFIDSLINEFPLEIKNIIYELGNRNINIETNNDKILNEINNILKQNKTEIDKINIKIGEALLTDIENSLDNDIWSALYNKDVSFANNKQLEIDFYSYIFTQMFRTIKFKNLLKMQLNEFSLEAKMDLSIDRLFPYLIVILSIREANGFISFNHYKINFLESDNSSHITFITFDNPIINLCGKNNDLGNHIDYELYWPLTPSLAMLITDKNNDVKTLLNDNDIKRYNELVKLNANKYLISNDMISLEEFKKKNKEDNLCMII